MRVKKAKVRKRESHRLEALPRSMDALELKANCYAVLDLISATGNSLLITKDGKPHVRLRPYQADAK